MSKQLRIHSLERLEKSLTPAKDPQPDGATPEGGFAGVSASGFAGVSASGFAAVSASGFAAVSASGFAAV
jgi:hypothetical protein